VDGVVSESIVTTIVKQKSVILRVNIYSQLVLEARNPRRLTERHRIIAGTEIKGALDVARRKLEFQGKDYKTEPLENIAFTV